MARFEIGINEWSSHMTNKQIGFAKRKVQTNIAVHSSFAYSPEFRTIFNGEQHIGMRFEYKVK